MTSKRSIASLLLALVALALTLTACVRFGFEKEISPVSVGLDGGPGGDGGVHDGSGPDLPPVGLNEPCGPPACATGLVCTGVGTDICRPACGQDAGPCPDNEVCGRPADKPEVALACLSSTVVGLYGDCSKDPCDVDLKCMKGTSAVCIGLCADEKDCSTDESCIQVAATGQTGCLPKCAGDSDCPSTMKCTGFGVYPQDHCTPTEPGGVGTLCTASQVCQGGQRCVGNSNEEKYCYQICPTGVSCSPGDLCVKQPFGSTMEICFPECHPLDSPVKCANHEVCYVDPKLDKAYCIPVKGDPTTCTGSVPCVSGKICVDGYCRQACDAAHPCPGTMACMELNFQGTPMPWKACAP